MAHKIIISFEAVNNTKLFRDTWVSAIWYLLAANDEQQTRKLHNSPKPKGFVWNVVFHAPNQYTMEFSSIRPDLIDAIRNGASVSIHNGSAFPVSNNIYLKVLSVTPVEDFHIGSSVMRLSPVTGVIIDQKIKIDPSQKKPQIDTAKKPKEYKRIPLDPYQDRIEFSKRLKINLIYKAKVLLDQIFDPKDIRIRVITSGSKIDMPFRNIPLRGNLCSVQIEAPKPILETALYAGIGRMNGLGFGMMTPAKKATA